MFFIYLNLFKGMCVCVCVCVCMCICVCVCVCVDRSQEFFLLSLLRFPLSVCLWVTRAPGYSDLVFSKIFYTASLFETFLAVFFLRTGISSLSESEICLRVLNPRTPVFR